MIRRKNPAETIAFLQGYSEIKPIHEGYSGDRKYLVIKNENAYLLRTFEAKVYPEKEREFAALRKMNDLQVRCSRPLEMGLIPNQELGYMLLTFIEGVDGEKALPSMPTKDQYRIGLEAGQELKKIHLYEAPAGVSPWYDRKAAKHERYLGQYRNGRVKIKGDSKFIAFIENHIQLMNGRPNLFQHDDFHIRNLVIKDKALAGVIDFNRCDWGDPVHEFLKVGQFSSEISIPFSVGQIRGYFDGRDPDESFWMLYSLYIAMSSISFIIWTEYVCPNDMSRTMTIIDRVLDDHDGFERIQPKWYSGYGK